MRPFPRNGRPSGWPFWLLIAAWFCANSPQAATYSLIVWAKGSQHFSHQERLKEDVARLLTGKEASSAPWIAGSAPALPFAPQVPIDGVLKKLDLTAPLAVDAIAPGIRELDYAEPFVREPSGARYEPLLPPPRARAIA
jgi:hypothetical protein